MLRWPKNSMGADFFSYTSVKTKSMFLLPSVARDEGNFSLSPFLTKDVFLFSSQEKENSHRVAPGGSVDIFITADKYDE